MHELGITRNVVAIVGERAQGQKVLRVTLEVGRLSGMLPDAIRFYFDVCSKGTPLEGATLQIVDVEKKYWDDFALTKDLYLFLGTVYESHAKNYPNPFVIIGTFHPKPVEYNPQGTLF